MVAAAVGAWIGYERVYLRGGDAPLPWREVTAAVTPPPRFRHAATGSFRSEDELRAFLREVTTGPAPELPRIDFGREVAVVAASGPRGSTGYAVRVAAVREERGRIVVRVRERSPRVGDVVAPRVTYPFVLATIPRRAKEVVFEWEGR